jgi:hypothetical protein
MIVLGPFRFHRSSCHLLQFGPLGPCGPNATPLFATGVRTDAPAVPDPATSMAATAGPAQNAHTTIFRPKSHFFSLPFDEVFPHVAGCA